MRDNISNEYIGFWKCKQGVILLDIFNVVQFEFPKHLRSVSAQNTFLSSWALWVWPGMWKAQPSLRVAGRGSEALPPPVLTVTSAGPSGTSPCALESGWRGRCCGAAAPRCSALPAEGNQPKRKLLGSSPWNECYSCHTPFSRRPACKAFGKVRWDTVGQRFPGSFSPSFSFFLQHTFQKSALYAEELGY